MDINLTLQGFWSPLAQITGINIVLSGDNAVVVAMASRSLPPLQQRRAILWGSFLAILLRIILTIFAIRLLGLDWMKVAGSALLLWIGIRLMLPEDHREVSLGTHLLDAIRIILIADAVMSLDNVIAVAAAAKGSFVLLMLSLVISIPIIIFGSSALIKVMKRWPVIITGGAGLLGWVAGGMLVADPALEKYLQGHGKLTEFLASFAGAAIVVGVGSLLSLRMRSARKLGERKPEEF